MASTGSMCLRKCMMNSPMHLRRLSTSLMIFCGRPIAKWVRRIQEAEGRAKFESAAAADARLRAEDLARDSEQLRMALQRETARRLAAEAHAAAEAQHAEHEAQRSAINEQRQLEAMTAFDAMRRSTSWRITAPLRSLRSRRNAAGPVITQPPPAAPVIPAPVQLTVKPRRTPVPPRTTVHQFHSGAPPPATPSPTACC